MPSLTSALVILSYRNNLASCSYLFLPTLSLKTAYLSESVVLESTAIYRGFLVQGRLKADEKTPVGQFLIANGVRLMDCHMLPNVSRFI